MKKLLFVCLGNICRSPLGEGIAQDYIKKNKLDMFVDSCGTSSFHVDENPCPNSIKIAKKHDIDISYLHAREITEEDFKEFDIIIALDKNNYSDISFFGCPDEKLFLLGDYGYEGKDIPDPYYFEGFEGFEKVFDIIQDCTISLINSIK